jgi:CBS domain-containing protein
MKIKDKPDFKTKPKPVTFSPDEMVQIALNAMCEKNIGSIIVTNADQTIAGIVTERDMMRRVLGEKRDPETTKLSEIMSINVKAANEDDDLVDWMHTMSNERFRHLPIVDADGKLVNMMSQGDFMAYTWPDLYAKVKQDLKGRLGKTFQILLIIFTVITLGLIAFNL